MRRIPPQRARIPATQSLSNIQSCNNKAKPAISGTSSFNQSRRNGPKSDNKAPEFSRRQGYCSTNDSNSAVGSLHDISDDGFDRDNRKTRHLENQTMVSEPLRHQSSSGPRTTSTFEQDSKKNASNGLPEQHTLPGYDDTLDEHWLSFSDQMEFDYKLDSDSAPEDSLSMRTSRKVPSDSSAEIVPNNDTIGDIDKLLMEDISSPRLSPVLRPIMDARDCKRRRDVTEAKPKVKKHLVDSENKESHKVNDPGNSISDNDKYTERDNELKNRNKSEKDHGPGAQSNTSAQSDQSIICHDNDMIPAGMHPQLFNVPRTTMDFKSQLDGLSGGFMTSLSNMLEAVQNVDSLHASINLAVLDRCSYLDDRGKSLHVRMLDLHKEAGMLHSKATQAMEPSNSHEDALAERIMKYATSRSAELPAFPGDDVESLPSDYEYEEGEEEEEVEEISEMDLLQHLDASMPPILLAQELFNDDVDSKSFKVLTADNGNELFHKGYTILDDVIDLSIIQDVREWSTQMFKSGQMDKASGKHNEEEDPFREGNARGDYTIWVSPGSKFLEQSSALNHCVDWFSKQLHEDLIKLIHLHGQAEYQLAYYPPDSSHYERHRDSFPTNDREDRDQRRVTAIVYFNPDWTQGDGGELRVFDKGLGDEEEKQCDIAPKAGRCVLFLSGVMDHAVLPSFSERIALTSWYR